MTHSAGRVRFASVSTLGLQLWEPRSAWLATLALAAVYFATMARDLSLYDSGELALAAVQLGLAHPPGQPLHTLLGHLASALPGLPKLVSVNLVSVVPGALTLLPATSLAQALLGASSSRSAQCYVPWLLGVCALHGALWEPATRVEVYSLANFFAVWAAARVTTAPRESASAWELATPALALGLCASVNPMIALCTGSALAPAVIARVWKGELTRSALWVALVAGFAGLLPYAYVPWVAQKASVMVWGAPHDPASAVRYFTLRDYAANQGIELRVWLAHLVEFFFGCVRRLLFVVIVFGIVGHVRFRGRSRLGAVAAPLHLLLTVGVVSSNVVWHLDIPDYDGYVASSLWLVLAGLPVLCVELLEEKRRVAAVLLVAAAVVSSLMAEPVVWSRTRHRDHLARSLAQRVLDQAPPRAIVIAEVDHLAGSLFYLQEAEHARPDVVVIAYGLASSRWHWEHLYMLHPELASIALVAPGGKSARVRRLMTANPDRAVLIERFGLAGELGLSVCPGEVYLRTGSACSGAQPSDGRLAADMSRWLEELDAGSPGAQDAIAQVSYTIGDALWQMGYPRAAAVMLLAGVPKSLLSSSPVFAALPVRGAAHVRPEPRWKRAAALGDAARNLYVTSMLLAAHGQTQAAFALLRSAALAGLPEANDLLARSH